MVIEGQTLFLEILSWPSLLLRVPYSFSVLRTSQMNPSLRGSRSVIARIRIAVVPTLPHMLRVAGCNGLGAP
jgi:hypothetical protein